MPYDPRVEDRAGEFMFLGISQAGKGIARGLEAALERAQSKSKERKAYSGLLDALHEAGTIDEIQFESLKNADTDTMRGTVDGLITANTLKNEELRRAVQESSLKLNRRELAQGDARQRFYGEMEQVTQPPMALSPEAMATYQPKAPNQSAVFGALNRSGFSPDARELDSILEMSGSSSPARRFSEDPVSGFRFMEYGKQVMPSGVNPEKANVVGTVYDESGRPITGVVRDARGAIRNLPAESGAREQKMTVDALVEAEKALRALDDDIAAWHNRADRSKRDPKNVTAPDPKKLEELQKRKARLERQLDQTPAEEKGQEKILAEAQDAIKRGADPAKVKQRLKEKYGVEMK